MGLTSNPQPLTPGQWYADDTYYQILLVEPETNPNSRKYLKTTLVTKTRKEFEQYKLDDDTRQKINKIYQESNSSGHTTIGSTLPSTGSVLNKDLKDALLKQKSPSSYSDLTTEVNNFYEVFRTLLHTRQMSQLIAKTWDAQLEAKKLLETPKESDFLKWAIKENQNPQNDNKKLKLEILDGLIARYLFLFSDSSEPDELIPKNLDIYYPLTNRYEPTKNARFLILPSSKGWQSIGLSLLMAGQVYYRVNKEGKILNQDKEGEEKEEVYYRQVSQSILSTGEIVMKYALEVSLSLYKGDIQELDIGPNQPSPAYLAILPYPAIPPEVNLSHDEIKSWAEANDTTGESPFYIKDKDGKYLIGVQNHTPPNPYLPSSCC